jgi:type II secretory pathway pseudopilin PulG
MSRLRISRGRPAGGADEGFVLVYVLMVITIVTVLVGGVLVVSSSSVVPTQRAAFAQAAQAAAQGGLNAFVAYADKYCSADKASVGGCSLPSNFSGARTIYSKNGYSASYAWRADADPNGRYFRVASTGTTSQGGVTTSKTLTADVTGGASLDVLDYGVVTGYETQSSASVLALDPERYIYIDPATAATPGAGSLKTGNDGSVTVHWSGASPGTSAGKVAVCNATFSGSHGRASLPPTNAPNPYVDWSESALAGNSFTHYAPCQTAWGSLTKLLPPVNPADGAGGYFSRDAMFLSNSWPGGPGPLFDQPVQTMFDPSQLTQPVCGTAPGQYYRAFDLSCAGFPVDVGGGENPASTFPLPVYVPYGPTVPASMPTISANACVYNGPTRILLRADGTAVVTSPQTTSAWVSANAASRPAQCYAGAGSPGTGMAGSAVNLMSPSTIRTIFVQDDGDPPPATPALRVGSSGWNTTGQKVGDTPTTANSVFWTTSGTASSSSTTNTAVTAPDASYTPAPGDNPSTKKDGAWTPAWTSYTAGGCGATTSAADLRLLTCYLPAGGYATLKSTVQKTLTTSTTMAAPDLTNLLSTTLAAANSTDSANSTPVSADASSHRWAVTTVTDTSPTDGCAPATTTGNATTTPISAPSSDPFFSNRAGSTVAAPTTTTACLTATVTAQVGTCTKALVAGACTAKTAWGSGVPDTGAGQAVPQFTVTVRVATTTVTTTTTPAVSSFPDMRDVTQYNVGDGGALGTDGPGDLYVEGTVPQTLALVAQNDAVVTGNLSAQDPDKQTVELVGQNNVRLYHPVKCAAANSAAIAATTVGFCPNDLTGLYSSPLPDGSWPYQQYINMRPDLSNLVINGAVFALGNAPLHFNCPAQPTTTGVCGGEFTTDNFNRGTNPDGSTLGTATVTGTVAMQHHSPLGEEWEIPDVPGQTSRPYSGYQFNERYQNLKSILTGDASQVLNTGTNTASLWHIISISAGGS